MIRLSSFAEVEAAIEGLAQKPGLGWALAHCAQSIEMSVRGFPTSKGTLFQKTIGRLVLSRFLSKKEMSHDLTAAIPGAPAIDPQLPFSEGAQRLKAAIALFRAHPGPFAPHFAYGHVDRARYEAVQSLHVANHLSAPIS
jgi:hypothetical protein